MKLPITQKRSESYNRCHTLQSLHMFNVKLCKPNVHYFFSNYLTLLSLQRFVNFCKLYTQYIYLSKKKNEKQKLYKTLHFSTFIYSYIFIIY